MELVELDGFIQQPSQTSRNQYFFSRLRNQFVNVALVVVWTQDATAEMSARMMGLAEDVQKPLEAAPANIPYSTPSLTRASP